MPLSPDGLFHRAGAAGLPVDQLAGWLDAEAFDRLQTFIDHRATWGATHNLSGPRALDDPWGADVLDGIGLALISPPSRPLIDVGAGSGVPGLIVACLQPARPVVLVEPIAKRTAFLRSIASRLGLTAVRVERGRWPLPRWPAVGSGDVVSRAVVDPADWPALAVSGGASVGAIVRMLAARRPPCDLAEFVLERAVDYTVDGHGARTIERWVRVA